MTNGSPRSLVASPSEVNSLTLALVVRIEELGERYAETVGALDAELERLEATVAGHLADMGVE